MSQAYCIGQAKSGTASLHGLLAAHHRSAHEPERPALLEMIQREAAGDVDAATLRGFLQERDARLGLDYDVAWPNQFVARHLVQAFPEAKFISLVRDPYDWLASLVGHLASRQVPPEIPPFLAWWLSPVRYPPTRHDHGLVELGLFSVDAYLHGWRRHVRITEEELPTDRTLVLRTEELDASHETLARFLGFPASTLDTAVGHRNRGTWSGRLEDLVEPAYVRDRIAAICA